MAIIGFCNGLLPSWYQATTQTNAGLLSVGLVFLQRECDVRNIKRNIFLSEKSIVRKTFNIFSLN